MVSKSIDNSQIPNKNRFFLASLWIIITLSSCYLVLFLGVFILGDAGSQNFVVITLYTYLPGIIAVIFLAYFKTGKISSKPFQYPGFHWLAFGAYYTAIVLSLTILVGFFLGELSVNNNYSPFPEDQPPIVSIPIIDIAIFLVVYGFLLLFSPGGFPRVLGEEYGWRGYLLPQLIKSRPNLNIMLSIWIVGAVWFIYHIPFFTLFAPINDINNLFFLLLGSAGVFFGANVTMCWAYLKTKNLWPVLSLHFIWNLTSPLFTGNIYSSTNRLGYFNTSVENLWLVNGEGLIGGFFHFYVGFIFLILIYRNKDQLFSQYQQHEIFEDLNS